jgi:hypothetical protein
MESLPHAFPEVALPKKSSLVQAMRALTVGTTFALLSAGVDAQGNARVQDNAIAEKKRVMEDLLLTLPTAEDARLIALLEHSAFPVREAAHKELYARARQSFMQCGKNTVLTSKRCRKQETQYAWKGQRLALSAEQSHRIASIDHALDALEQEALPVGTRCILPLPIMRVNDALALLSLQIEREVHLEFSKESRMQEAITVPMCGTLWEILDGIRFANGDRLKVRSSTRSEVCVEITSADSIRTAHSEALLMQFQVSNNSLQLYTEPKAQLERWSVPTIDILRTDGSFMQQTAFLQAAVRGWSAGLNRIILPKPTSDLSKVDMRITVRCSLDRCKKITVENPFEPSVIETGHSMLYCDALEPSITKQECWMIRAERAPNSAFDALCAQFIGEDEKGKRIEAESESLGEGVQLHSFPMNKIPRRVHVYMNDGAPDHEQRRVAKTLTFKNIPLR